MFVVVLKALCDIPDSGQHSLRLNLAHTIGLRPIELPAMVNFENDSLEVVGKSTGTNVRRVYDRLNGADVNCGIAEVKLRDPGDG